MPVKEGDKVKWKWGQGYVEGRVKNIYHHKITRKIKGNHISRNGNSDNPALYIFTADDGNPVLKLESEVQKVS